MDRQITHILHMGEAVYGEGLGDHENQRFHAETSAGGADIDRQSFTWAVVKDGILYFSIGGLDGFDNGLNAYIVAVDTNTDKTLWLSKPNTCNSENFLIIDNSIVCGYGGTGVTDYVNVLNRFTGVQKQHLWVATAPYWFALGSDGKLYVSLYDKHISFKVNR